MINEITLLGRIGKDCEVKTFDNGGKVANTTLATDESYKDKNNEWVTETEWHSLTGWNKVAEAMERKMTKGKLMYVKGKVKTRSWEDSDGKKQYKTEIQVSYARAIGGGQSDGATLGEPKKVAHPANAGSQDDDLPF